MLFILLLFLELLSLYFLSRKVTTKFFRILRSPYLFALLFFPGTVVHEMSHFFMSLILLVPSGKIELFPRIEEGEVRLGSVAIAKTDPIRRTLIGIAPVIFGTGIILGVIFYIYTNSLFSDPIILILVSYVIFEIGNTMFSSRKDMEGVIPVFIAIAFIVIFLYALGLRVSWEINLDFIQKLNIFILVPIIIDLILVLV